MTPFERDLGLRAARQCAIRGWCSGMLTHQTVDGGYPTCPPGTPLRIQDDEDVDDWVISGRFGVIVADPSIHHPEFERLMEAHDASVEKAKEAVVLDLSDPATRGALLGLAREATADPTLHVEFDPPRGWKAVSIRDPSALGKRHALVWGAQTEGEAILRVLEEVAPLPSESL